MKKKITKPTPRKSLPAPATAIVRKEDPSLTSMLSRFLESPEFNQEKVGAFSALCDLYEKSQRKDAERSFNVAFVELQKRIPEIQADKVVPDGRGGILYAYCSFEEIYRQCKPFLTANGFSVRFSQSENDGRITETCHLMHISGHSVTSQFTTRAGGGGPPGWNDTKRDLSASTIAQREAFCDILNIPRIGREDDARLVGGKIDKDLAAQLRQRVRETDSNEEKFLRYAGVTIVRAITPDHYEEIPAEKYEALDEFLRKKEARRDATPPPAAA